MMVSLAETHLKLLLSADTGERELQGFTLVQLLLVRMKRVVFFSNVKEVKTINQT